MRSADEVSRQSPSGESRVLQPEGHRHRGHEPQDVIVPDDQFGSVRFDDKDLARQRVLSCHGLARAGDGEHEERQHSKSTHELMVALPPTPTGRHFAVRVLVSLIDRTPVRAGDFWRSRPQKMYRVPDRHASRSR